MDAFTETFLTLFVTLTGGALVVYELVPRMKRRSLSKRSLAWPLTEAKYIRGEVLYERGAEGDISHLQVDFTYTVAGIKYNGRYEVAREGDNLRQSLKNGPFAIRYNPDNPTEYFVDPYRDVRASR